MTSLVASPNSKWIVTGSGDGTIIIWNAEGGAIVHEWLAHRGSVDALSFSPDSRQLVSAGKESRETLVIWDLSHGIRKLAVLACSVDKTSTDMAVFSCSWSPDGALVASTCLSGPVCIWDALTFRQRNLLPVSASNQKAKIHRRSLRWSSDSCYLVWSYTTSQENGANFDEWAIWSPRIAQPPRTFPSHPTFHIKLGIRKIEFDPESRRIVTALYRKGTNSDSVGGSEDTSGVVGTSDEHSGCVLVWDIKSSTTLAVLEHDGTAVEDVSFSPDGRYLLSIDGPRNNSKIWDTESWRVTASLEGDGGRSQVACFSPDGSYVATISNNGKKQIYSVRLWRIGEILCTSVFAEHKALIYHLAFSPNAEFLASGDIDGIVHIRRLSDFIEHRPRSIQPVRQT